MRQYIVDAFTNKVFSGNTAAVCGSARCQIADDWSKVLGKQDIVAYQASNRGGMLHCHLSDDGKIQISGEAVLFAVSEIQE